MKILKALSFAVFFVLIQLTGNAQLCTLNCPPNLLIKTDSGQEGAIVIFSAAGATGECGTVIYSPASGTFFRTGSHSVSATASTGEKCFFTITVTDNEPPVLSELTLSSASLWPASNRMKKVSVSYTVTDNAQEVTSVMSVSSNDMASTTIDWEIINNHMVRLNASRLPNGEPRIYWIAVTSTDEAGNKTTRTTSIAVSKTMTALKPVTGSMGIRN